MRPTSLLLSLAGAAAALVLPAAARLNYYKGLTTVADLETLRVIDDEGVCVCGLARVRSAPPIDSLRDPPFNSPTLHAGRFRKHTLVAFTLPDTDGTATCALDQLDALRFPHIFFHLPGTIFEMIQARVNRRSGPCGPCVRGGRSD